MLLKLVESTKKKFEHQHLHATGVKGKGSAGGFFHFQTLRIENRGSFNVRVKHVSDTQKKENSCLICAGLICRPPACAAEKVNGGRPLTQRNVCCDSLSDTLCFNYTSKRRKRSVEEVACDAATSCVTEPSRAQRQHCYYSWTSFSFP